MFKATDVDIKIRDKNKYTYQYGNKSLFVQNFRPLFIPVSPCDCHGTH